MTHDEMQTRLNHLVSEVERTKQFIAAVERGEHDNEAAIVAAVATMATPAPRKSVFGRSKPDDRYDMIRKMQRDNLILQAYNRINKELYPEIHDLDFRLKLQ